MVRHRPHHVVHQCQRVPSVVLAELILMVAAEHVLVLNLKLVIQGRTNAFLVRPIALMQLAVPMMVAAANVLGGHAHRLIRAAVAESPISVDVRRRLARPLVIPAAILRMVVMVLSIAAVTIVLRLKPAAAAELPISVDVNRSPVRL